MSKPTLDCDMYARYFKRPCDLIFALAMVVLLAPVFLLVIIGIKLESPGPIFFTQERMGYKGKIFRIIKFRSMVVDDSREEKQTYGYDPDVTPMGFFLRRLKIDELPQLVNVLQGDMSLVGPRPCLPSLARDFNEDGRARLLVRPGMTGLAQVSGNICLTWLDRWKLDRQYIENVTLINDLKIIFRTVLIVVFNDSRFMKGQ